MKARKNSRSPSGPRPGEAVMIVDVQRAFSMSDRMRMIERIEEYAGRYTRRIFTRFIDPLGSLFHRILDRQSCSPGSKETALLIKPAKGDLVIDKYGYGLQAADIARIRRRGIRRVFVCGMDTDACVLGVMFTLFDAGIECRLKEDYCWSSSGLHLAALKIVREQFPGPK